MPVKKIAIQRSRHLRRSVFVPLICWLVGTLPGQAQLQPNVPPQEITPPRPEAFEAPSVESDTDDLPSLRDLFPSESEADADAVPPTAANIRFTDFELQGSTAFDDANLTAAIRELVTLPSDRPASYPELVQITAVTG
ncbi:MAG: hypothetical protein F6K04_24880, partial [Leptolyngbya sp. SIO4C5]|nr:hypothetical protein [Leptolyngbya sp. SIO4C5]